MTPQELKASILQLAIQGKLVEQRPDEGTGEELYGQIQAEKQVLIKAGKIKKEKARAEITEDEISFDIPESWKWIRLGEIASVNGGFAFKSTNYTADGVRVIRISDFNESGFVNDNIVRHLYDESLSQYVLDVNNILLCMTGGTVGKSLFVTHIDEMLVVNQRVATIKVETVLPKYVYQVILAPITQKVIQHSKNSTNDNISMDTIKDFLIPLPPLAEQKRIVAKIEELLPLIDRYEQAWSKLEEFNKRFPVDMQKSILQMAIQGKLVPQLPEEGTGEELFQHIQEEKQRLIKAGTIKKEKPLPEITDDEIPFDIPDSWRWCRLSELVVLENGDRSSRYPVDTDYVDFGVPFFGAKDMSGRYMSFANVRYISETKFEELGNGKLQDNDFVCLLRGSVGKISQFKKDRNHETGFICAQMVIVRSVSSLIVDYLYTVMNSPYYFRFIESKTTGTAVRQLPAKELGNLLVPLPPLAEQKRIVAKLEEILPLCERLK